MGKIEKQVQEKQRRVHIQRKLTLALFRLTAYSSRAFAPEAVLVKRLGLESAPPAYRRMRQAFRRLEQKGLLTCERTESGWRAKLTPRGKELGTRIEEAERIRMPKPKRWDGKWRIVIFDVWERRRDVRDKLRRALIKAGFKRIQDSVWVSPYDCEELIVFLRIELRLGEGVLYLVAEGIENDIELRQLFSL